MSCGSAVSQGIETTAATINAPAAEPIKTHLFEGARCRTCDRGASAALAPGVSGRLSRATRSGAAGRAAIAIGRAPPAASFFNFNFRGEAAGASAFGDDSSAGVGAAVGLEPDAVRDLRACAVGVTTVSSKRAAPVKTLIVGSGGDTSVGAARWMTYSVVVRRRRG